MESSARSYRLALMVSSVVLLVCTAACTGIAVWRYSEVTRLGMPVAVHWSSVTCADRFSEYVSQLCC